jgi:peptide/nickel transport system substrate-binding protein
MNKKLNICLALVMACAIILSACQPSTTPTTVVATNTSPAKPTTAAVETSTSPAQPTTITVKTTVPQATDTPAAIARGDTLTYVTGLIPPSLDPATGDPGIEMYYDLAYDSLISHDYDGGLTPLLATSWSWVGTDFKAMDMELRAGVKFSDGTDFNADAVKAWIELMAQTKTPISIFVPFESVEVTGPLSVRFHMKESNPLLPLYLSRTWLVGIIPCLAAVNNPDMLKADTCGAGPYMLDKANTVTGSVYTYIPNPYYWRPEAIYWNKIIVKVLDNAQARLDALKSGEAQALGIADPEIVDAAVESGMQDDSSEQNVLGLDFLDKSGTVVPALGKLQVRQALNYAIDREAITKALAPAGSKPTSSEFLPGSEGYDPAMDSYYTYDVEKAKQLLTEAGYPNGFEITILTTPSLAGWEPLAQAIASYWKAIGIDAKIESKQIMDMIGAVNSVAFGVTSKQLGGTNPTLVAYSCCYAPGTTWNPDKTPVPELTALIDQIRTTNPSEVQPLARQVNKYITENAWFVSVYSGKLHYLFDPSKVSGPQVSGAQPVLNIVDIRPVP